MAASSAGGVKTTWGKQIQAVLPVVTDPEGDPINIQFIDQVNRNLPFSTEVYADPWTKLVSETLVEGKNAV